MAKRKESEKRRFSRMVAMHRDSGNSIRETKASVRKAEETRKKILLELEVLEFLVATPARYQSQPLWDRHMAKTNDA